MTNPQPIADILQKLPSLSHDPDTHELYIPLPPPHSHIRLTPARLTDAPAIVSILNDPLVYPWLQGPPYPYKLEHAESWLRDRIAEYERLDLGAGGPFGDSPFRAIREVGEDGSDVFVGTVGVFRSNFNGVEDPKVREAMQKENDAKALGDPTIVWMIGGDPTIVWMIGDYLSSSHHGRGIMTSAIRTPIAAWAIPHMAARRFRIDVLVGSTGSRRVFEKLGFRLVQTTEGGVPTQGKREEEVGVWVLEWEAPT